MNWLKDLKVGDVVYFVHYDSRYQQSNKEVTVETRGRKWITLSNNERVNITQDLFRNCAICHYVYGSGNVIYPSEIDYTHRVKMTRLRRDVTDKIRHNSISDEQIIAISKILGVTYND